MKLAKSVVKFSREHKIWILTSRIAAHREKTDSTCPTGLRRMMKLAYTTAGPRYRNSNLDNPYKDDPL